MQVTGAIQLITKNCNPTATLQKTLIIQISTNPYVFISIHWIVKEALDRAFKVQKSFAQLAVRSMMKAAHRCSKKLNLLPLRCLYIRDIYVFAHRQYFKTRDEIIQMQTRTKIKNRLYRRHYHKGIYKNNCFYMCIRMILDCYKDSFKLQRTKWLLTQCFY